MITIELPWPDKRLNPNVNAHWRAVAKARAEAKKYAYYTTREKMDRPYGMSMEWAIDGLPEQIAITYTFYPPCVRTRDDDNFISAMKGARDGVAKALGIDDSRFHTQPAEWGEVVKGGKVVLTLEEMK